MKKGWAKNVARENQSNGKKKQVFPKNTQMGQTKKRCEKRQTPQTPAHGHATRRNSHVGINKYQLGHSADTRSFDPGSEKEPPKPSSEHEKKLGRIIAIKMEGKEDISKNSVSEVVLVSRINDHDPLSEEKVKSKPWKTHSQATYWTTRDALTVEEKEANSSTWNKSSQYPLV